MASTLPLNSRISTPCKHLQAPGPSRSEVLDLIASAVHVPDHGRLRPWRFILIEGAARERIGSVLFERVKSTLPEASEIRLEKERTRFSFAPCIVAVVLRPVVGHKVPEVEQMLSGGAVCMNLLHAAHQAGFGAQWLTGFAAYDPFVKTAVGVASEESVLGYIHIGTRTVQPPERDRPEASALLTVAAP